MNTISHRYFDSDLFDDITAKIMAGERLNMVVSLPNVPVPLVPAHFVKCWNNNLVGVSREEIFESCSASVCLKTRRHLRVSLFSNDKLAFI